MVMGNSRTPRRRIQEWLLLLTLLFAAAVLTAACEEDPAAPDGSPAADSRPRASIAAEDVMATAVAFGEAWAAERPTTPTAPEEAGPPPTASCTPPDGEPANDSHHFLHWAPDGSRLIFNISDTIWTVDSRGTNVDAIVDADPESDNPSVYEFYADLSPDGSRMVYSTCEYPLVVSDSEGTAAYHLHEIASADLGGGGRQRLTESQGFDSYPVWSPDGSSIAFIRTGGFFNDTWVYLLKDGLEDGLPPSRWWLGGEGVEAVRSPPAWSPSGESLALVGYETSSGGRRSWLYTGGARDPGVIQYRTTRSAVFRVTEATGPPSWSPDGEYIAFTRSGGEDAGVYVIRPNGHDLRRIVDGSGQGPLWPHDVTELPGNVNLFRGSPAWTSDSDRLLFITREIVPGLLTDSDDFVPSRIFTVGLDGGDVVELDLPLPAFLRVTAAAWSPDGSKVAVSGDIPQFPGSEHAVRRVILTADPDGGNMRMLAAGDTILDLVSGHYDESVGRLFEWNRPESASPVDTSSCSGGFVVPDPGDKPGLVQDCETLLTIRDALAGRAELNWSGRTSISDWQGVGVGGEPLRVQELALGDLGLTGALPPELGQLTGLKGLDISGDWLTGQIPPELGGLEELEALDLSANLLSGSIPQELGSLESLRILNLRGNVLSGSIPSELGFLSRLEELYLSGNRLEGPIPREFGMLESLSKLTLSGNRLGANIPPGIYRLVSLTSLDLWEDGLWDCVADEYPEIPEERSDLERCRAES